MLGYEGIIKIGNTYCLGTGTSIPQAVVRLESAAGYGGQIKTPLNEMGIGAPHNYDWSIVEGSLDFEMTSDIFRDELYPWLKDRQSPKDLSFKTRSGNVQDYTLVVNSQAYWKSINISADGSGAVTGSMSVAMPEGLPSYVYGDKYITNVEGMGLLCPVADFPPQLNPSTSLNINPIPSWKTYIEENGTRKHKFLTWSVDFSQEAVRFFGCNDTASPAEPDPVAPSFLAMGPMTVIFTATFLPIEEFTIAAIPVIDPWEPLTEPLKIYLDVDVLELKRIEVNEFSDNVGTGNSMVPLNVEYTVYEIK